MYQPWRGLPRAAFRLIGIFGLFGVLAQASTRLHPHADRLRKASNPSLTITRFAGDKDFFSASTLRWEKRADRYYPVPRLFQTRLVGFDECGNMLSRQERFALNKMGGTSYIPTGEMANYLRMSARFNPLAVDFMLANRDLTVGEATEIFGETARDRLNPFFAHELDWSDPQALGTFMTASLWSVAGQTLDPQTGKVRPHPMPWQFDKRRKAASAAFDREKYKIVFEWGRSAQDLAGEVAPLNSVITALNYQEMRAIGGKLEDTYVMFHSLDEAHTRLYLSRFPDSLYPPDWEDRQDALFLVPLREAMAFYPPSQHSDYLHGLREAAGPRLSEMQALDLTAALKEARLTELDFDHRSGVRYPNPLIVHDVSKGAALRRAHVVQAFGFDPSAPDVEPLARYVGPLLPAWPRGDLGQFPDAPILELTQHQYEAWNAVEISNLDPQVLATDSRYAERALIGVFNYYLNQLIDDRTDNAQTNQALDWLRDHDVKFGITTAIPGLKSRLEKLKPFARANFGRQGLDVLAPPEHDSEGFVFTTEQIRQMILQNVGLYEETLHSVRRGWWAAHLRQSDVQPF